MMETQSSEVVLSRASSYDQLILFGDSLFEHANTQERGFAPGPAIQEHYLRRLDVVNRGFNGFNTRQALKIIPRVIPDPACARVRIMAILFGSNDSCFGLKPKGPNAFVPLDEFKENLVKLVTHAALRAHSARLILIALPPVEERRMEKRSAELGYPALNRTNVCTKTYADATREVANDHNIAFMDLFSIFGALAGWKPGDPFPGALDQPENEVLKGFLYDGLHLSPDGYEVLVKELLSTIIRKWPDQDPKNLPFVIPVWDDPDAWQDERLNAP